MPLLRFIARAPSLLQPAARIPRQSLALSLSLKLRRALPTTLTEILPPILAGAIHGMVQIGSSRWKALPTPHLGPNAASNLPMIGVDAEFGNEQQISTTEQSTRENFFMTIGTCS